MNPIVESLGWTLLHSLWQGALIVAALRLVWPRLARASSQSRYLVACAALALFALAPLATFFLLHRSAPAVPTLALSGSGAVPAVLPDPFAQPDLAKLAASASGTAEARPAANFAGPVVASPSKAGTSATAGWLGFGHYFRPALPWLVAAWLAGVGFNLIRIAFGWRLVRRLAGGWWEPWPVEIEERVRRLADRLGIRRVIGGGLSLAVSVPTVVGWLRPVILVPPALLAGLSPSQLDALFAHELAHIRRHDFIVNLFQAICEAVFYYHPAIHAINRRIRAERENACDDIAVGVSGDPISYARALATLEAARAPNLALAASGDGELLGRVRRVLALPPASVASGLPFAAPGGLRVLIQSGPSNGKSARRRSLAINLVTAAILIVCVTLWYRLPGGANAPAAVQKEDRAAAPTNPSDALETRTFSLSRAEWFRLLGPVNPADRLTTLQRSIGWYIRYSNEPAGSSIVLDGDKLIVTQTAKHLAAISDEMNLTGDKPRATFVNLSESGTASKAGEPGSISVDVQVVDASAEDLQSIGLENYLPAAARVKFVKSQLVSGSMVLGDFDTPAMVRALARKSGGTVISLPSKTVDSGSAARMLVANVQSYPKNWSVFGSDSGTAAPKPIGADYTMRNIGVEFRLSPEIEVDQHGISLEFDSRITTISGWTEYPGVTAGGVAGPPPIGDLQLPGFYQPMFSVRDATTKLAVWDGATIIMADSVGDQAKQVAAADAKGREWLRLLHSATDKVWPRSGFVAFATIRIRLSSAPTGADAKPSGETSAPLRSTGDAGLVSGTFPLPRAAVRMLRDFGRPGPITPDPFAKPVTPPAPPSPVGPLAFMQAQEVDFDSVPGADLKLDESGLQVTQTPANLEKIRIIAARLASRANVVIEARVVELEPEDFAMLDLARYKLNSTQTKELGLTRTNGPSLPITGNFDIPALVLALTRSPGRGQQIAMANGIALSGSRVSIVAAQEFRFPLQYGDETIDPSVPSATSKPPSGVPAIARGTPQNVTMRNLGTELRLTPTVSDDGRSIDLNLEPLYATTLVGGTASIGGKPKFDVGQMRADFSVPDGETVAFELPFKEEVDGKNNPDAVHPRHMLVLLTARILGADGVTSPAIP